MTEDHDDIIRRIVDAALPLSQAKRDRLAALLDGVSVDAVIARSVGQHL